MDNPVLLCLLVLASTDWGKALPDLTGTQEVDGTWKASITLPCVYEPSADFKQEAVMWKTSLPDHGLRTIFRRDSNSGDQTLLTHFRNRIRVPKDLPGNVSLLLEDLEMADGGEYTCEVVWVTRNKSRITKEWMTVLTVVKVAVTKPIITAGTVGPILPSGGKTSLTCQADGSPRITYRWFKAGPEGHAEQVGVNAILHFNSLQVSDGGTYYCEARNQVSSAAQRSDAFQLTVKGPSELPTLRPSSETAKATVTAESDPVPSSLAPQEDESLWGHQAGNPAHHGGLPLYVIVLIAVLCVMVLVAVFSVVFCRRKLRADHTYEMSYNNPLTVMREESSPAEARASEPVPPRAENNYTEEPTKDLDYVPMGTMADNEYETLVLKIESEYEVADDQQVTGGTTWRPRP